MATTNERERDKKLSQIDNNAQETRRKLNGWVDELKDFVFGVVLLDCN